jgi:hypothetical protein
MYLVSGLLILLGVFKEKALEKLKSCLPTTRGVPSAVPFPTLDIGVSCLVFFCPCLLFFSLRLLLT